MILVIEMTNIINLTEALRCLITLLGNTNQTTMKYYFNRSHTHSGIYGRPFDFALLH